LLCVLTYETGKRWDGEEKKSARQRKKKDTKVPPESASGKHPTAMITDRGVAGSWVVCSSAF